MKITRWQVETSIRPNTGDASYWQLLLLRLDTETQVGANGVQLGVRRNSE